MPTAEGWLYLATTINLYNREVSGDRRVGRGVQDAPSAPVADMACPGDRFATEEALAAVAQARELAPLNVPTSLAEAAHTVAEPSGKLDTAAAVVPAPRDAVQDRWSGGAVEFDGVVPASGNLGVAGKQFWLGPARAGVAVTFWPTPMSSTCSLPARGSSRSGRTCP